MAKQKSQVEKFREAAREAGTDDSEERFNTTLKGLAKTAGNICPECHHVFQGKGWDGIDAHWKAKHETVMPYAEAWPLIRAGKYTRPKAD
jgi:hypothetical protein